MQSDKIRQSFFDFMTSAPRKHIIIENTSLVPVGDPTILFTNSGMFPLVPYLLGEKHPLGTRLCNFQRCLRTSPDEIDEIGDNRHTLFFEMMGNWSLNDYFKETQIPNVLELYVEKFGLDVNRLYVSVFAGDADAPRDEDSIKYWTESFNKYGVKAKFSEDIHDISADSEKPLDFRIFPYPKKKNWWQRGEAVGELGGPDTEMFFDTGTKHDQKKFGAKCDINCDCGRFIEIGNSVFIQYKLNDQLKWEEIAQKNVDFGGGFERVVMVSQGKTDIFSTDLYEPVIKKLEELTRRSYSVKGELSQEEFEKNQRSFRIIADHIRAATFIISDGIIPSNKDQGYILRSLIRRMIRRAIMLDLNDDFSVLLSTEVIGKYKDYYPNLTSEQGKIFDELNKEEIKFRKTLSKGLRELQRFTGMGVKIDGKTAFFIYETYGFPIEMILEEISSTDINDKGDLTEKEKEKIMADFEVERGKHRLQSRAGAEQKFKGGLADHSTVTTRLHTAHHLLLAALQQILGKHVKQRGSNITAERLRIDVSHAERITAEQLKAAETIVNEKIRAGLPVEKKVMPKAEAEQLGAEMEFGQKYGDLVNVYFIKDPESGETFSAEFCGGPHVSNTKEIAESGMLKIIKEESVGSGVRRIKAILTKDEAGNK